MNMHSGDFRLSLDFKIDLHLKVCQFVKQFTDDTSMICLNFADKIF